MNDLLKELKELLDKHEATIVRSASEGNKLVLCKMNPKHTDEYEFNEDMCSEGIEYEWFNYSKRIH